MSAFLAPNDGLVRPILQPLLEALRTSWDSIELRLIRAFDPNRSEAASKSRSAASPDLILTNPMLNGHHKVPHQNEAVCRRDRPSRLIDGLEKRGTDVRS